MNLEALCPFREKTPSRRVYLALARSSTAMMRAEIARAAHLTAAKTTTLLAAYVNPMHRAPLERVGVRLSRGKDGGYKLETCKPKPKAQRPPRWKAKTPVKKKEKKRVAKPSSSVARAAFDRANDRKRRGPFIWARLQSRGEEVHRSSISADTTPHFGEGKFKMKNPSELSRRELIEIVAGIRDRMYLDINPPDCPDESLRDAEVWNPDKEVCGADLVEAIDAIMESHGLRPSEMRAA